MLSPVRGQTRPALLLAGLCLLLGGCGLATVDTAASKPIATPDTAVAPEGLAITTTALPAAQEGGDYEPVQLTSSGAQGPVNWSLEAGALPEGVTLTGGGIVAGCPEDVGLYHFEVAATDGLDVDVRRLVLAVDTLAITVDGWMLGDEIWGGEPLSLQVVGAEGAVRFELVESGSGGAFDLLDEEAGRAVWIPGDPAEPRVDHLRIVDDQTGATAEIRLDVLPHPAPNMKAEFGTSDVWYVSSDHNTASRGHGLPRDWDEALRQIGLRSAEFVPTKTDRLVEFLVRRSVLAALNAHFERNADGSRGAGFAISFPLNRPAAPYTTPAKGAWAGGAPGVYNTISLVSGPNRSLLGRAFLDDASNSLVENDTSTADGDLGAFVDAIAYGFNSFFQNNWLPENPIGSGDESLLRDLIHGRTVSEFRADIIQWAIDGFGRSVAIILAHEIGHSLGLPHQDSSVHEAIMGGSTYHYPGAEHHFLEACQEHLRHALPGPGRVGGTPAKASAPQMPEGGVAACEMHLPACSCK